MEFENIWRIGVFKFRNIGDVLLMTPALRAIREAFPHAHITAVVNATTDAMLRGNTHIDELLVYPRPEGLGPRLWVAEARFAWAIRQRSFDLTFDFSMSDRAVWCAYTSLPHYSVSFLHHTWGKYNWRRPAISHGFLYPPGSGMHEVEKQLWLLEQVGIGHRDRTLAYNVGREDAAWAHEYVQKLKSGGKRLVHVHPVSRWMFKCWRDDRMAKVIDWLQEERHASVVMTSSPDPGELARGASIISQCRQAPEFLGGTITLGRLAALSREADCFLGVDTAPMHLAAAVATPVVALFGPSHSGAWAPWTPQATVIQKLYPERYNGGPEPDIDGVRESMDAIQVDEVQEALARYV